MQTYPDPMRVPYQFIDTTEGLLAVCEELGGAVEIIPGVRASIDTETEVIPNSDLDRDGPGPWAALSIAAVFRTEDGAELEKLWVVDMTHIDVEAVSTALSAVGAAAWNASFEDRVFLRAGIDVSWRDPMRWQCLLDLGTHVDGKVFYTGLADASRAYCGVDLEGKGDLQKSFKPGVPMTDDQKAYAGQDAIVNLWLARLIWQRLIDAQLDEMATIVDRARRYIDMMQWNGLPLDSTGWRAFLQEQHAKVEAALVKIASLTGGGELTLFGEGPPTWSPTKPDELREALNRWAEAEVRAYLKEETGEDRLLTKADKVDSDALKLMGGELAEALLEWGKPHKILTTYGEKMMQLLHDDERFHAKYHVGLVATLRLSSDGPNMQNSTPEMKRFNKPQEPDHVFLCADYSQAELRGLGHIGKDQQILSVYERDLDIHTATAGQMFNLDMDDLERSEPDRFKKERKKAKPINFGIGYGMSGRTLARNLTIDGIPTTAKEGDQLLDQWLGVYSGVDQWLKAQDAFTERTATNLPELDWHATWDLHDSWKSAKQAYWKLRNRGGIPSAANIARELMPAYGIEHILSRQLGHDPSPEEVEAEIQRRTAHTAWVRSFRGPVILRADGQPFSFESRTVGGNRRVWNISTEEWIWEMVFLICLNRKKSAVVAALRDSWARDNNRRLTAEDGRPYRKAVLNKIFDGTHGAGLRESLVLHVLNSGKIPPANLMEAALTECVRGKRNEVRNHPIQGAVGTIVLHAMGELLEVLKAFETARPVQSVHDSLVFEVHVSEARALAEAVKRVMEASEAKYFPSVPPKADVEIQRTLDEKDILSDEELDAMIAAAGQPALAAA